jgi:hypothetical protein
MSDRARQALWNISLIPAVEATRDIVTATLSKLLDC